MDIKTIASNLANRINQEHYIEHELKKVYAQGIKDSKAPEMLEMLKQCLYRVENANHGDFPEKVRKLIKEATNI